VLKKRVLSARQQQQHNFSLGAAGEARAVQFLQDEGFQILDRNVRLGTHEIDIIAFDPTNNELVFVEVKTRASTDFGDPSRAVSRIKIRSLIQVAARYRRQHHSRCDFRIDVIAIADSSVQHFQSVTWNL
jgi:putative endonuclease